MSNHKLTASEEMYLITISNLNANDPAKPVAISTLAEELDVQPVSANQMINKLAKEGWVNYFPYQGVILTERGSKQAYRILLTRRLWEVFLVRDLGITKEKAEASACELEHHISMDIAKALDGYLDYPEFYFQGNLILREKGEKNQGIRTFPLKEMMIDSTAVVVGTGFDLMTQNFLSHEGINPGVSLRIKAIGHNGDYLIECAGRRILISEEIASEIMLRNEP